MIGRLNHIAIAVPDLAKATELYRSVMGAKVSEPKAQPAHGVTVVFVELPNTKIELLHPLGHPAQIGERTVEPRHGLRDARIILGDLHHLMARDADVADQPVREDLVQVARRRLVRAGDEIAHVDVISAGEAQQHLRGQRPLVALQMVEIARRNAQLLGHARLVQPQFPPQHPKARTQIELAISGSCHD